MIHEELFVQLLDIIKIVLDNVSSLSSRQARIGLLLWYVNYNIISLCMHELRHNRSCSNFRIYFTTM